MDKIAFLAGFLTRMGKHGIPYEEGGFLFKMADGKGFVGKWIKDPKTGRSRYVSGSGAGVIVGSATPVSPAAPAATPPPAAPAPPRTSPNSDETVDYETHPPVYSSHPYWQTDDYRRWLELRRRQRTVTENGNTIDLTPKPNVKRKREARAKTVSAPPPPAAGTTSFSEDVFGS